MIQNYWKGLKKALHKICKTLFTVPNDEFTNTKLCPTPFGSLSDTNGLNTCNLLHIDPKEMDGLKLPTNSLKFYKKIYNKR